VSHISLLTIDY